MIDIRTLQLPQKSWVYLFKNGRWQILYIGKAKNISNRVFQYFRTGIGLWKEDMVSKSKTVDYFITDTEEEALILERNLIQENKPPYNSLLKWDGSYVYIRFSPGPYPQISLSRKKTNDKAFYIGPKPWQKELKNLLHLLRQLFKFRTCSDAVYNKGQACSDKIFWLCDGYCEFKQDDQILQKEYKANLDIVRRFFEGKSNKVVTVIAERIEEAIKTENYEWAAILKKIYMEVDRLNNKQNIDMEEVVSGYFIVIKSVKLLEKQMYFMVYTKMVEGKIIDVVKLKNDEDTFLQDMINDGIISSYKLLEESKDESLYYSEI